MTKSVPKLHISWSNSNLLISYANWNRNLLTHTTYYFDRNILVYINDNRMIYRTIFQFSIRANQHQYDPIRSKDRSDGKLIIILKHLVVDICNCRSHRDQKPVRVLLVKSDTKIRSWFRIYLLIPMFGFYKSTKRVSLGECQFCWKTNVLHVTFLRIDSSIATVLRANCYM